MAATAAILYLQDQPTIILRNIDRKLVETIESQCGRESCLCTIEGQEVDYGKVSHVIWMDRADIGD